MILKPEIIVILERPAFGRPANWSHSTRELSRVSTQAANCYTGLRNEKSFRQAHEGFNQCGIKPGRSQLGGRAIGSEAILPIRHTASRAITVTG